MSSDEEYYDAEEDYVGGEPGQQHLQSANSSNTSTPTMGSMGSRPKDTDQTSEHSEVSSVSEVIQNALEDAMQTLETLSTASDRSRSLSNAARPSSFKASDSQLVVVHIGGESHFLDASLARKLLSPSTSNTTMVELMNQLRSLDILARAESTISSHSLSSDDFGREGASDGSAERNSASNAAANTTGAANALNTNSDAAFIKNLDTGELIPIEARKSGMPDRPPVPSRRRSLVGGGSKQQEEDIKVTVHHKSQRELTEVKLTQQLTAHAGSVWAMRLSVCGKYIATAGQDKRICVWEVEYDDDKPVIKAEAVQQYTGHEADIVDLAWSKNKFLLSASMDKTVRLFHVSRPEHITIYPHRDFVTSVCFHPQEDKFFVSGCMDHTLTLWHIPENRRVKSVNCGNMLSAVALSPDGDLCLAGAVDGNVKLFLTQSLEQVGEVDARSSRGKNSKGKKITGMQFTKDGEMVLISTNDSRIRLYRIQPNYAFSLVAKFKGPKTQLIQIAATFSPAEQFVVCGSEDHRVYVWNKEFDPTTSHRPFTPRKHSPSNESAESFEVSDVPVTTALFIPRQPRNKRPTPQPRSASLPLPAQHSTGHGESVRNLTLVTADLTGEIRMFVVNGMPKPVK